MHSTYIYERANERDKSGDLLKKNLNCRFSGTDGHYDTAKNYIIDNDPFSSFGKGQKIMKQKFYHP